MVEVEPQYWVRPRAKIKESGIPRLNNELEKKIVAMASDFKMQLYKIDDEIYNCKQALRLLQPMGSGRIDILYWKHKLLPGRHPQVFAWQAMGPHRQMPRRGITERKVTISSKHRNQRQYRAQKLSAVKLAQQAKKTGLFKVTVQEVRYVLSALESLLKMRTVLIDSLRRFKISQTKLKSSQVAKRRAIGSELEKRMPEWAKAFEARLLEHKTLVEDHLLLIEKDELRRDRRGYRVLKEAPEV